MNIPGFTAQASLYRTSKFYGSWSSQSYGLESAENIVPAYFPGAATQARCNEHIEGCLEDAAALLASLSAACALGCIAAGPFYAACVAPCLGGALATSDLQALQCTGRNLVTRCCPKLCGAINPFEPGEGCCDANEHCVAQNDPNARRGCCPSDQTVCAGKCCAKGESCCGETCCPPNYYCRDGFCSEFISPLLPPGTSKPPKPPKSIFRCRRGLKECGPICCPEDLECCSIGGGQVACMTNCLH